MISESIVPAVYQNCVDIAVIVFFDSPPQSAASSELWARGPHYCHSEGRCRLKWIPHWCRQGVCDSVSGTLCRENGGGLDKHC